MAEWIIRIVLFVIGSFLIFLFIKTCGWLGVPFAIVFGLPWVLISWGSPIGETIIVWIMRTVAFVAGVVLTVGFIRTCGWLGVPLALVFGLPCLWISWRLGNGTVTEDDNYFPADSHSAPSYTSWEDDHTLNPSYDFMPQNVYYHQDIFDNHH